MTDEAITDEEPDLQRNLTRSLLALPLLMALVAAALLWHVLAAWRAFPTGHALGVITILAAVAAVGIALVLSYSIKNQLTSLYHQASQGRTLAEEQADQLRRRERWLAGGLSSIQEGVLTADVGGIVTFLNAAGEKLTGWEAADAVGRAAAKVLAVTDSRTSKPEESVVTQAIRKCVTVQSSRYALLVAPSGAQTPIEAVGAPLWDEAGRVLGAVVVFREVGQRQQAAEDLQASRARQGALFQAMPEALLILDGSRRITEINPAVQTLLGYQSADLSGQPLSRIISSPAAAWETRLQEPVAVTGRRADGSEFPMELIQTRFGQVESLVCLRDARATKKTEETVRLAQESVRAAQEAAGEARRAQSGILAGISDELRTPLTAVLGYSELLHEELADQSPHLLPDVGRIQEAGKHLLALTNDLLNLSKIEAERVELFLEDFEIAALVHEVENAVGPLLEKNANHLQATVPDDAGAMFADRAKLRQCLLNLLTHAGKFTTQRTIGLTVSRSKESDRTWVIFQVTDTGSGITEEQREKLLVAFPNADSGEAFKSARATLGLTLCRRFSQMMGGDLLVNSALGQGYTFTLKIPADVSP